MKKYLSLFLISAGVLFSTQAFGMASPLSVSLVPPVQFPPSDFDVTGVRISLLGDHRSLYGLDFGLIGNITQVNYVGLAVSGIFNLTHSSTTIAGLQAAGFANVNTQKTTIVGLQIAAGVNENVTNTSMSGIQIAGLANLSGFTTVRGFQISLFNKALDVYGFQIGLINMTSTLHGIQIGLMNFNEKGTFSVSPILNIGL